MQTLVASFGETTGKRLRVSIMSSTIVSFNTPGHECHSYLEYEDVEGLRDMLTVWLGRGQRNEDPGC